jgi:hypothetical protein
MNDIYTVLIPAERDLYASSLIPLFIFHNRTKWGPTLAIKLLDLFIAQEVQRAENDPATLMRGDSLTSKLLRSYSALIGRDYLKRILSAPLEHVLLQEPLEVRNHRTRSLIPKIDINKDPSLTPELIERNQQRFLEIVREFLDAIFAGWEYLPSELRDICASLKTNVEPRFPGHKDVAIGGFLFLRWKESFNSF